MKVVVIATVRSHIENAGITRYCAFDGFAEKRTTQRGMPGFGPAPSESSPSNGSKTGE